VGGNLNALGLILVIVLTGAVLLRDGTWPQSAWRVVTGILTALGVLFLAVCLTTVLWPEADPSHQLLISSACLALVMVFARPGRLRALAALAVALSTIVWSFHVLLLVGPEDGYTGNPSWTKRSCRVARAAHLRTIRSVLMLIAEDDDRNYPAGWLAETELGREIPADYRRDLKAPSVEIQPLWHTPLTGLSGKRYHELSLWYPGGPLRRGIQRLEFRER
jgi:hypothetical protein